MQHHGKAVCTKDPTPLLADEHEETPATLKDPGCVFSSIIACTLAQEHSVVVHHDLSGR
jgi:hydroxymethylpyrimidine/phosphomethylpyrimidine kinase